MELGEYQLEDLLLAALKSEVDAREFYMKLSRNVKNAILRDRLMFLSDEEDKHRYLLERIFKKNIPDKKIVLPDESPVPLPEIVIRDENQHVSELLAEAMEAESAASDFYSSFAERFEDGTPERKSLLYFSSMEMNHYRILELEMNQAKGYEVFDTEWPMMHVGP